MCKWSEDNQWQGKKLLASRVLSWKQARKKKIEMYKKWIKLHDAAQQIINVTPLRERLMVK